FGLGVALVVVIEMEAPAALLEGVRPHSQKLHPAEAGPDGLEPLDDRRALLRIWRPLTVEITLAVICEALQLDLASRRGDRREERARIGGVGRELEALPLLRRNLRAPVPIEHQKAAVLHHLGHSVVGGLATR